MIPGQKNRLCLIVSYGRSKTFYFLCYFQGRPVRVKIGKLGYKSLASTQVYARLAVEPIRESMQRGTDKMLGVLNMDTTPNQPLPISL